MCGICGIIDLYKIQEEGPRAALVRKMNSALIHRGPDGEGFHSDSKATLAMRRLSIIDTEGGGQPIYNEDRSLLVILNGEIYNYRGLTRKLIAKGHQFKTKSDTEVLIHLYKRYGEKMFKYLKGMFSFCIYDLKKNKVIIARDRFGEKPLFFHYKHHILSFSSEIKSLLENSWIPRKLNHMALPYFLRTATIPEPHTLLKEINSLSPGHYLLLDDSGLKTVTYFRPEKESGKYIENEQDAVEFMRSRLEKAVKRQMVSDVPIGAFLSGGIDSSTVVALMQQQSKKTIKTFNVKFEEEDFDESAIARKVAERYNTDHNELVIPNYEFDDRIFWEIVDHVGMPFRDTSAIPTYLISREISKHVKVALSGDGGDEIFGGYDIFQWYLRITKSQNVPEFMRLGADLTAGLLERIPGLDKSSKLRKIRRGLGASMVHDAVLPIVLSEMFTEDKIEQILSKKSDYAFYSPLVKSPNDISDLRNIMYYRLMHVLPVNMLTKVDRMSMANSLEVRTPFLDIDLFTASMEIPDHLLIKKGTGKYLLRAIMKDQLPSEVFNHQKTGFNIPLHKYMNDKFKSLAHDLLFENNPWPLFFKEDLLNEIFRTGIEKKSSDATQSVFQATHQLWMMMQLLGWARRFKVEVE